MNKRRRNIIIVVGGLVLLIIVAVVVGKSRGGSSVTAKVQTLTYTTFTTKLPESGVVQRPQTQTIATLISGNLGQILVKPGDHVAAGQLLATIVNPQIISNASSSADATRSAQAHARSAALLAQVNLVTARSQLTKAENDLANGSQSGLGYGGTTAADQRATAEANASNAASSLHDAQRIYAADKDLYANKGISLDALDEAKLKLEQAQNNYDQTRRALQSLNSQLSSGHEVLVQNVEAARRSLAQAEAAASASGNGTDVAAAQADAAKAADDNAYAQEQAANTQIRAPFSGVVESIAAQPADPLRQLQPGDPITQSQPIFTLAASDAFIVRAKVDEQDIANVTPGLLANVTGEDFPGKTLTGHVAVISPLAQKSDDPSSTARQVLTTIRLEASPPYLRDGMSVDVDILTSNIRRAIVVPNDAILTTNGKKYVWVVKAGTTHKQAVTVGKNNESSSIIRSGLQPGDSIVAEKNAAIVEGSKVTPAPSPSPSSSP